MSGSSRLQFDGVIAELKRRDVNIVAGPMDCVEIDGAISSAARQTRSRDFVAWPHCRPPELRPHVADAVQHIVTDRSGFVGRQPCLGMESASNKISAWLMRPICQSSV